MIQERLAGKDGVRAFHPVKQMVAFEDAKAWHDGIR
jgi:hypothetical protein